MKKGFTLIELVIVIVILGIFATIALPAYQGSREKIFDNQAKADLKLMHTAEKNYYLDMGYYYPSAGSENDINVINSGLAISLPVNDKRWNYSVNSSGCSQATRATGTVRSWHIQIGDDEVTSSTCP